MTEILRNFREGNDFTGARDIDNRNPQDFIRTAVPILHEAQNEIYEQVLPRLENHEGYWHPLGFMAWKLGNIATVGTLRLHIWPEGMRKKSPRGPKIHDHAWHITSLVMDGEYTDTIYDVQEQGVVESEEERTSRKLLRVYSPRFSHTSAALETDGTCATADPIENRIFNPGSIHTIKTGVFHVDSISEDRMVSTLLIESPTVEAHPRILMDTPGDPLGGAKVSIPHDDAVYAKKQVLRSIR